MSSRSLDGIHIKVTFDTEPLIKKLDELDLEGVGLAELKEIIQDHMIVTFANDGPKGICFPGREDDEEKL